MTENFYICKANYRIHKVWVSFREDVYPAIESHSFDMNFYNKKEAYGFWEKLTNFTNRKFDFAEQTEHCFIINYLTHDEMQDLISNYREMFKEAKEGVING